MKNQGLIITAIVFFLIVNTMYFWIGKFGQGFFAMLVPLALLIVYFVLLVALLYQIYIVIKEKLTNKSRLVTIGVLILVLLLTFLRPSGIINFAKFESKTVLFAEREGGGNCAITLNLKEDYTFKEMTVCFGVSEAKGNYRIQNDTIFFDQVSYSGRKNNGEEFYKFAVIEPSKFSPESNRFDLVRYKSLTDTVGNRIWIIKNELDKLKSKNPDR
ncbi:MAG: hypothetical protein PHR19_03505 [Bacteroidales bacterium]|nr:hypothetical protein [Bacteroidales bacterium]